MTLKDLRTIIIISFIGAGLYILAHITFTEINKPDYSGNDLSLEAVQTIVRVRAWRYD